MLSFPFVIFFPKKKLHQISYWHEQWSAKSNITQTHNNTISTGLQGDSNLRRPPRPPSRLFKKIGLCLNFIHTLFTCLFTHDDLVMQVLVWLHTVWFRALWFGTVWFGASYINLRWPHILKHQISGRNLILHPSKYSTSKIPSTLQFGHVIHTASYVITEITHLSSKEFTC